MVEERLKWEAVGRTVMKLFARQNAHWWSLALSWMHPQQTTVMVEKSWCGLTSPIQNPSQGFWVRCSLKVDEKRVLVDRLKPLALS